MGIENMPISVTLVYSARAREVAEMILQLDDGCTVAAALQASGWFGHDPSSPLPQAGQGVWGKKVSLAYVLQDHDRLEVYRALTVDPKAARRERFVRQGAKKAAGLFAKRRAGAKAGY